MQTAVILKKAMKENKRTPLGLSRDMNVSPAIVYRWLKGAEISKRTIWILLHDPALPEYVRELAGKINHATPS